MLTEEQITSFWDDGVVVVDDVLTDAEVDELRAACTSAPVAAALDAAGYRESGVHLLGLTKMHEAFLRLATSKAVVDRVIGLLGPNVQLQHSKLATKPPAEGKGAFAWHQDFAFFPHTNTDLVAVMVILDDATPENCCMYVARGSHRNGLLNHRIDDWFTGVCQTPPSDDDELIAVTPRSGGISIHHCLALHSSPPNRSGRDRRGLVLQYRNADAHQLADTVFDDTGLQVAGTYSGRVRCTEAVWDLPRWPDKGYGGAWNHIGRVAAELNEPDEEVSERARAARFAM